MKMRLFLAMAVIGLLAAVVDAGGPVGIAIQIGCLPPDCEVVISPDPVHASPGDGINWHVSASCEEPPCDAAHPKGFVVDVPGLGYNSGTLHACDPSPILTVPNMPGVYPYTVTGSQAIGTLFVCLDLNGDQVVGVLDLLVLLTNFGPCADPDDCPGDFDDNDFVDVIDLLSLLQNLGQCPGFTGCPWDVNGDATVNHADVAQVIDNLGPCDGCPEDVNGDGEVDGLDVAAVVTNQGPCP